MRSAFPLKFPREDGSPWRVLMGISKRLIARGYLQMGSYAARPVAHLATSIDFGKIDYVAEV